MSAAIQYPLPDFDEQQPQPNLRLVPTTNKPKAATKEAIAIAKLLHVTSVEKHRKLAKQLLDEAHALVFQSDKLSGSVTLRLDSESQAGLDEMVLAQQIAFEFAHRLEADLDYWNYRGFSFDREGGELSLMLYSAF